jgi:dimethylsulfone monooxygenase
MLQLPEQSRRKTNPLFSERKLKLGTFSTNLEGGAAMTSAEGALKANWASTRELAEIADRMHFEAIVPVGRWKGFGGTSSFSGPGFEAFSWAAGLGGQTQYPAIFSTSHVPTIHPIMAAKQSTTIDHITGGRFAMNIVTGWHRSELEMFGSPLMEHDVRYDCASEWIEIIKQLWTEDDEIDYTGRYYQIKKGYLQPKPIQKPHPVLMSASGSPRGRQFTAKYCDVAFIILQGLDVDQGRAQVDAYKKLAREEYGRDIAVWTYGYVVQGDTEKDALDLFNHCVHEKGDWLAAENMTKNLGIDTKTMPPEGFRQLKIHFMAGYGGCPFIGTKEQIVEGLRKIPQMGLSGLLLSWPYYRDGIIRFEAELMPLLHQDGLR